MSKKPKIVIAHPTGNANVRGLLKGLHRGAVHLEFHTTIAVFSGNIWNKLSQLSPFTEFSRRKYPDELRENTVSHSFWELGRLGISKLPGLKNSSFFKRKFSIEKVYDSLDREVAKRISTSNQKPQAIYAYEDGAFQSFIEAKKRGIKCIYDLPIGYWREMHSLLQLEFDARPEWASTLKGFSDPVQKLHRKDQELQMADAIFVASSFTKETLKKYPGALAKVHIVPYGFPKVTAKTRNYLPLENQKLKLLFVGGLSQRKGIANVLEAAEALKNKVNLTVIGRKPVSNCIPLNEGLKNINYIPSLPHSEILNKMREADIFVFPSFFEGYGLVITEAMAQGTPVITTRRTCGADFIEHGQNGWLIEPGNTQILINLIESIYKDPSVIKRHGENARKTAQANPFSNYGNEMAMQITNLLTEK